MAVKVDKGVPLPKTTAPRPQREKYPWSRLKLNESFFVPEGDDGRDLDAIRSTLNAGCHRRTNAGHGVFTLRTVEEDGRRGIRVWRIE